MALETIEFEGKQYVPSKQASGATGYTQDYIGQLARGNTILARRIGGLWYINMDSLMNHKKESEAYVPEPPMQVKDQGGSIVSFDGREYISSKRAAEITRYTQDYVGQLARGGKIASRQVSGRWYVSKDDLKAHKEQKDALLAKVQADSVGIQKNNEVSEDSTMPQKTDAELFTYISEAQDTSPALPEMIKKEPKIEIEYVSRESISAVQETDNAVQEENATHHIAIRAMSRDAEAVQAAAPTQARPANQAGYSQYRGTWDHEKVRPQKKVNSKAIILGVIVLLFVTTFGYVYSTGIIKSAFEQMRLTDVSIKTPFSSQNANIYENFVDNLVKLLGGELHYTRK